MARGDRPVGRQKRVGTGGGGVFRRGDGLGGSTGGPVGDAGGYSDRSTQPGESGGRGFGGLPSGGSLASGGGCLRIIVVLIVIGIALYFLSSLFGGALGDLGGTGPTGTSGSSGFQSAASAATTTYIDQGAYPVATTVSERARNKRTTLRGSGDDTVTMMVYLCATDLEAQGGMATADLNEMLHAEISDKVNDRHGDTYTIKGRVPAKLNGQLVDIVLSFDDRNPYGVVLGAQKGYDVETQTETVPKGLIDIVAGDTIDYLCDYYTYDGTFSDTYLLGEQYTATGEWEIENLSVGGSGYQMTYRITDIYGNRYWTPSVTD